MNDEKQIARAEESLYHRGSVTQKQTKQFITAKTEASNVTRFDCSIHTTSTNVES